MASALVILVWVVGGAVNMYLYYKRRCGVPISMETGVENPGLGPALLLSAVWPIALFSERFRHPEHCKHPAHAAHRTSLPAQVEEHRKAQWLAKQQIGAQLGGESDLATIVEMKFTGTGDPPAMARDAVEMAHAANDVSGAQIADSQPSAETDGFNEGDRVRLAEPLWTEPYPESGVLHKDWCRREGINDDAPTYPAGSKGTIVYPGDASPEFIENMKASGDYLVFMDDGRRLYAAGLLPGVDGVALERILGQYQVTHRKEEIYLRPKFDDGDHVRLTQSFTSENSGKNYEAGWEGVICPLTVTLVECWRSGYYPVALDDSPFGADRGMITVPASVLELVLPTDENPRKEQAR